MFEALHPGVKIMTNAPFFSLNAVGWWKPSPCRNKIAPPPVVMEMKSILCIGPAVQRDNGGAVAHVDETRTLPKNRLIRKNGV